MRDRRHIESGVAGKSFLIALLFLGVGGLFYEIINEAAGYHDDATTTKGGYCKTNQDGSLQLRL